KGLRSRIPIALPPQAALGDLAWARPDEFIQLEDAAASNDLDVLMHPTDEAAGDLGDRSTRVIEDPGEGYVDAAPAHAGGRECPFWALADDEPGHADGVAARVEQGAARELWVEADVRLVREGEPERGADDAHRTDRAFREE